MVEWCIVVTTPEEVILCALARESTATAADGFGTTGRHGTLLRLIPTRYVVPTDSVPILSVAGTEDGRIFLGGHDGSLHEMVYEGIFSPGSGGGVIQRIAADEDDDFGTYGLPSPSESLAGAVLSGSKRVLTAAIFGPSAGVGGSSSSQFGRPKKCRKVNHTSVAPGFVSAFLPGFVLRAASGLFGTGVPGGPIISLVPDEERSTLYALTSKGYVHTFDLKSSSSSAVALGTPPPPPRLTCSVDLLASTRRYLDSVARGRMYPPHSSSSSKMANVSFPGGGSGAATGVGGMNGARNILKIADAEQQQRRAGANDGAKVGGGRAKASGDSSMLHPISIHVVPRSESRSITLIAVTGGGLRLYLSALTLSTSTIGGGSATSLRPGKRFTLFHVRAPPPYTAGEGGDVVLDSNGGTMATMNGEFGSPSAGIAPGIHSGQRAGSRLVVEKSFSGRGGLTMLALDSSGTDSTAVMGNAIVVTVPDFSEQGSVTSAAGVGYPGQQLSTNAGIKEIVALPMKDSSTTGENSAMLPGGRIWDVAAFSPLDTSASVASLFFRSTTPTNSELSMAVPPAYRPPSKNRRLVGGNNTNGAHSSLAVANTSTGADVARGFVSTTLAIIYRILLNKPLPHQLLQDANVSVAGGGYGAMPTYRISNRSGSSRTGFSMAPETRNFGARTNRKVAGPVSTKSPRLPIWFLSPRVAPLSQIASQHLLVNSAPCKLLTLNSGGIHSFEHESILGSLSSFLMKSTASNMGRDENIRCFFESYGFSEGCSMCLSLAISSPIESLSERARQAALCFAHSPSMVPSASVDGSMDYTGTSVSMNGDYGISGYVFKSSHLYNGLVAVTSRLIRPIWYKPAVVVTEGRTVYQRRQLGGFKTTLPAKVELLLDEEMIEEIRKPLVALEGLFKSTFPPAVNAVPGANKNIQGGDSMDVDELTNGDQNLITRAMQYQSRALPRNQKAGQHNTRKDLDAKARLTEERNIHFLYRLVSRTVQLLTLMSHLRRAQATSDLPEVDWGLIHGLTYCHLVTTRSGQDRIETLLTSLVTIGETDHRGDIDLADGSISTVEADNLSALLSKQCYLYFSAGSRLTYQGFRAANAALAYPPSTPRRVALANRAVLYFRASARHWFNPALITGRLLQIDMNGKKSGQTESGKWYEKAAKRALEYGSPLARAADVLTELGCVGGVVDSCLVCASNFGGARYRYEDEAASEKELIGDNDGYGDGVYSWERGLYHRPMESSAAPQSSSSAPLTPSNRTVVSGIEVTKSDALQTCHAVLFHHMTELLDSASKFGGAVRLAEQMVAVCSSSTDERFLRSLYQHLIDAGHLEYLLRIDSPSLENWLANEKKDSSLQWRYYIVHGLDWISADIMALRASNSDEKISLDERIECLTRASNSYAAARERSATIGSSGSGSLLRFPSRSMQSTSTQMVPRRQQPSLDDINRMATQVSEQLDVAMLQQRILYEIKSTNLGREVDPAKLDVLETSLVPVSDLYNEYAGPLALYDMCLLILQSCRQNDSSSIIKLWKSIVCDFVIPCRTRDPAARAFLSELKRGSMLEEEDIILDSDGGASGSGLPLFEDGDWIPKLSNRVVALGRELYGHGADYTFPLDLIVRTIEGLRRCMPQDRSTRISWPLQILIDSGVTYDMLFDVYSGLVEASGSDADEVWVGKMSDLVDVVRLWVRDGSNDASSQLYRAVSSGGLLAQIDSMRNALESRVGIDGDEVNRILTLLSGLSSSIQS